MGNKYICVFCGKEHEGYGNSCWPIYEDENIRCCDGCNLHIVVPERIYRDERDCHPDLTCPICGKSISWYSPYTKTYMCSSDWRGCDDDGNINPCRTCVEGGKV